MLWVIFCRCGWRCRGFDSLKSPSVQQTLQFTRPVLKLSLVRSHLLWGEFSAFSAANAIHNFPIFVPPGAHPWRVDRGGMVWEVLPNTSTYELTSVIFGNLLIYHVLPLVWEIVRQTNRLGTRLCGSWMSTWMHHFWFTKVQPLLTVCSAVCGAALCPLGD